MKHPVWIVKGFPADSDSIDRPDETIGTFDNEMDAFRLYGRTEPGDMWLVVYTVKDDGEDREIIRCKDQLNKNLLN